MLLAEATYVEGVPADSRGYLCTAREAGEQAATAGTGRLLLTHLQPGTDPEQARAAAAASYRDEVGVAGPDLVVDLP